jgi:hypothetical protein
MFRTDQPNPFVQTSANGSAFARELLGGYHASMVSVRRGGKARSDSGFEGMILA